MKEYKNDSTVALARFGKDRRERTSDREGDRDHGRYGERRGGDNRTGQKRASYNPNFTEENRPAGRRREASDYGKRAGLEPRHDSGREGGFVGERGGKGSAYRAGGRPDRGGERYGGRDSRDEQGFRGGRAERSYGNEPKRRSDAAAGSRASRSRGSFDVPTRDTRREEGFAPMHGENRGADARYRNGAGRKGGPRGTARRNEANYPRYEAARPSGEIRLNRFIAQSGICSRREADDFILAGVVSVNGKVVTELGTKVKPTDEVRFNDSRVQGEKRVYLVLNKPKGYVTTLDDPHADRTVMDLVKGACAERIYPVGRLDRNSVGLLLFTNDGDLTRQLTHPSYRKKKIYQVSLDKPLTEADMETIAQGVVLEDGEAHADEIAYAKENRKEVGIEIHSGRNRIVRRIFEHLGYEVKKLDRVYYAGLTKKNLKRGAWRFLTREEVERLKSGQYE